MNRWIEILSISKSQLVTYLQCPRKYRFQCAEGKKWEFLPASFAFGRAVHESAARFYRYFQKYGKEPPVEDLLAEFERSWSESCHDQTARIQGNVTEENLIRQGTALLKIFHEEIQPRQIHAVELPFTVDLVDPRTGEIPEVKLVGYLDLVERDGDGNMIVAEMNTAAKRYSETEGENKLDGFTSAYALKQMGWSKPTSPC